MRTKLASELTATELRLTRVEAKLKTVMILSTFVAVVAGVLSGLLTYRQYREAVEKARVSFTYRLTPVLLPNRNQFYLRARIKNLSTREITLLGVTARVWKGNKWVDDKDVNSNPDDLIVADNLVHNCPSNLCPTEMQGGRLRRRQLDDITVESTEGEYELSLGPYPIDPEEIAAGLWVEGSAYTAETDHGNCAVHTRKVPSPGAFPFLCEESANDALGCTKKARCSDAAAPATFYELRRSDNTFQMR